MHKLCAITLDIFSFSKLASLNTLVGVLCAINTDLPHSILVLKNKININFKYKHSKLINIGNIYFVAVEDDVASNDNNDGEEIVQL